MTDPSEPADFNQRAGANLRALRASVGFSQTDLAEAMSRRGYSWQQQTVLKIEKGSRPLRFEEADAVATTLDCSLDDLRAHNLARAAFRELSSVQEALRKLEEQRDKIDEELRAGRERAQELEKAIMEASNG